MRRRLIVATAVGLALLALTLAVPALLAGPATAARHRSHAKLVGPALGVMWDAKTPRVLRARSLPTLSTVFLRSMQLHRKAPRGPRAPPCRRVARTGERR